jgi:hypothetical protein
MLAIPEAPMLKLFVLVLVAAGSLWSQSLTGSILGTVRDPSGAVVPGAKVKLTNEGTGIVVDGTTNASGDYVFPNLAASTYVVQVEAPGFRKAAYEHIELLLGATVRRDARLETGSLDQSIVVQAEAPVINTETPSIATVVDSHAVSNLPIDGRTLDALVALTPGNATDSVSNPKIAGSMYWGGNQFSVDGVNVNSHGNGGALYSFATKLSTLPSIETVQEVKVEANSAKAEFEGATAVTMISRSGTNQFHGMLREFNRNRPLTAKEFFVTNLDKPQFNRNEFGVNIGGPFRRNRTFFFLNYEGLRQRTGRPPNVVVPTEAQRAGDFGRANIRDPLAGGAYFPGNVIPTNRLDSRTLKVLTFVPLPNTSDAARNFATNVINKYNTDRATGKIDHRFSDRDSIALVYTYANGNPYFNARGTPPNYGNYEDAGFNTDSESLTWTHLFTTAMVNEFRFGRFAAFSVRQGQNRDYDPHQIFPDLYALPIGGLPNISATGITAIGDLGGSIIKDPATNLSFTNNLTWVRGRHTIKTGFDMVRNTNPAHPAVSAGALGQFNFNGRWTGNAVADMMLGYLNTAVREMPTADVSLYQSRYSAYVQDDWNIVPRLTLSYGVRYMVQAQMQEVNDTWTQFDLSTGTFMIRTKDGKLPPGAITQLTNRYPWKSSESYGWGDALTRADHNNFAPRVGFAWRVFRASHTVLRGGYGVYYSQIPAYIGALQMSRTNPPFALRETFESPTGTVPLLTFADPFPSGRGTISANPTIQASIRDLRNAFSQQWNLTAERQLPGHIGLRMTYLGNKTTRVPWYNFNRNLPAVQQAGTLQGRRPYQPWGDILVLDTNGNAFTNQMQVQVQRRAARGLYLVAHFTLTKSIDNVMNSGSPQNPYDARADRANSDGIRQRVFVLTATYALPFGRDGHYLRTSSRVLDAIVGGWNMATLTTVRSGSPFTPTITSNATGGWYATRANVVGDPHLDEPTLDQWFNPKAFAVPAAYTFGNAGRNILFGPGQVKIDAALYKTFRVTERFKLEFRGDAFNLPNHPNFSNPAANVSTASTFGRVRSTIAETNRAIQFAVKLMF